MKTYELNVIPREKSGKEMAKKIRRNGLIPAEVYGAHKNIHISVRAHEFEKIFEEIGEHSILKLNIDNKKSIEAIVKDFQIHPVYKNIIHIDFYEVEKGKKLRTEIPIRFVGTSKGVKKGGILESFLTDLEIECLPKDIPDVIEVDISQLDLGDSLHVKDVKVGPEIRILSNPEQVVVTVGVPSRVVVEEEVPEEEAEEEAPSEKAEE